MAIEKDITMKQFNGDEYDTLYPRTHTRQIDISDDTKSNFNLNNNSTLEDLIQVQSTGVFSDIEETDIQGWGVGSNANDYGYAAMAFGNGVFVAVKSTNAATTNYAYSTNGTTWTRGVIGNAGQVFVDIAYGAALGFVALTSSGTIYTSTNGTTWTASSLGSGVAAYSPRYITAGTNTYMVTCANRYIDSWGHQAYLSGCSSIYYNGSSWGAVMDMESQCFKPVHYGTNNYITISNGFYYNGWSWTNSQWGGQYGYKIFRSTNGVFQQVKEEFYSGFGMLRSNGTTVYVRYSGQLWSSTNGTAWTIQNTDPTVYVGQNTATFIYGSNRWMCIGSGSGNNFAGTTANGGWYSEKVSSQANWCAAYNPTTQVYAILALENVTQPARYKNFLNSTIGSYRKYIATDSKNNVIGGLTRNVIGNYTGTGSASGVDLTFDFKPEIVIILGIMNSSTGTTNQGEGSCICIRPHAATVPRNLVAGTVGGAIVTVTWNDNGLNISGANSNQGGYTYDYIAIG